MAIPILMNSSYPIEIPDISYFQNYTKQNVRVGIDYAKVSKRKSVRAVMVKACEGDWDGYLLSDFLEQAVGFYNVGLPVVPYGFWHYEVKPADFARRFKSCLTALPFVPTQLMVDIEDDSHEESRSPKVAIPAAEYPAWTKKAKLIAVQVRDSMDAVAQMFGKAPLWYGGEWYQGWWTWMAGALGGMDMSWIGKYNLHCASYTAPWMYLCTGFTMDQALVWQHTSTPVLAKQIEGFPNPGSLDMNYWLKSEAEFDLWIGKTVPVVKKSWEVSITDWARTKGYIGPDPVITVI